MVTSMEDFAGTKGGGRVSYETGFDSKQPKLETKLVLAYTKQNVCFGCFDSLLKQNVPNP
jgi:hypothetical protein